MSKTRRRSLGRPELLESRDVPSVPFTELPILPNFDPALLANVRQIAYRGLVQGLRSDAFLKVGDSNSDSREFLDPLGQADYNPVLSGLAAQPVAVQEAFRAFRAPVDALGENSFTRDSLAAGIGWTVPQMLAGVEPERAVNRAGIALVMGGTNDLFQYDNPTAFGGWLRSLVDRLTADGVVQVLSTIPTSHFLGAESERRVVEHNQVIAEVAAEKRVPLLNLWRALEGLPNDGLKVFSAWGWDEVHLTVSPNGAGGLTPFDLLHGQNLRGLLTLGVLAQLRQQVFTFDRAPVMPVSEDRISIAPGQAVIAVGSEAGQPATVAVHSAADGQRIGQIAPYPAGFYGGVRVAVGDVNNDGVSDLITAPGPGGGPLVKGYSGADGHELFSFFVFEPGFRGGVNVAVGDTDGDGRTEIVVGAGGGGGPRVRVFAADLSLVGDFLAFEPGFRGGVTVTAGDFGVAVGAGEGGAPVVKVFDPRTGQEQRTLAAFDLGLRGGVSVAAGDLDGDGRDELVTGAGPGGGPVAQVFDPRSGEPRVAILTGDPANQDGIRVAVVRSAQTIAVAGGGSSSVQVVDPAGNAVVRVDDSLPPLGAFVAG